MTTFAKYICQAAALGFIYVSLLSFNPRDLASFSLTWPPGPTKNLGGELGAEISSQLFFFFGLNAYLLPLLLLCKTYKMAVGALVLTLCVSTCFSLANSSGGYFGSQCSDWFQQHLGSVGLGLSILLGFIYGFRVLWQESWCKTAASS